MMKRIIITGYCFVLPATLFISWQADKGKKVDKEQGAKLYAKYSCKSCHGDKGVGVGDLRKAGEKYTDEQMVLYISNPKQFGNMKMPAFAGIIPENDFKPLIGYVKLLGAKPSTRK